MSYSTNFIGSFKTDKEIKKSLRKAINALYNCGGEGDNIKSEEKGRSDALYVKVGRRKVSVPSGWCPWIVIHADDVQEYFKTLEEEGEEDCEFLYGEDADEDSFSSSDGTELEGHPDLFMFNHNDYYGEWLITILKEFLVPNGYVVNGIVEWQGESDGDHGVFELENNVLHITQPEDERHVQKDLDEAAKAYNAWFAKQDCGDKKSKSKAKA